MNKVAERLTGWRQEEALGEPLERVFNIVNENTRKRCDNPVAKVLETGGIVGLANNTVLVSKDGTERVIEDSGAPILDKQNRTLGVVLVFRDATEKRRMQEERQKAQKLESLGILAGGIAHDFNNSLTAIIGNISLAEQSMPEGGVIEANAQNVEIASSTPMPLGPGKYVKISIRDQGIGIPEAHLTRIFDPYFTTKQKGSGIGLAVAYSIVDKHDGYITAESEGSGATFHVYLPAIEAAVSGQTDHHSELMRGAGKVLLMDDEQDIRTVGSEMLQALGYAVVCARDGAEAVEHYRQAQEAGEAFDAVILDLTIPGGMGAKDAVVEILALDASAAVIISSGYSNDPVIAQFRQYGFRGAVCKPYQIRDLGAILHEVLVDKPSGQD